MEFLVTMTTHVPDGTSEETVQAVRTREAARSGELATERHLLRLWRPPLQPGEWRTLGLFAADGGVELEAVLASMPLRVWRTDEVTPLSPHPNDPARKTPADATPDPRAAEREFLTTFTGAPPTEGPGTVEGMTSCAGDRAGELGGRGYLERLWTLPGPGGVLGLWEAPDSAHLEALVDSLSLPPGTNVETTPLSRHPSDPGLTGG